MQYVDSIELANYCQLSTILLTLVAYVPQWIVLIRTKSSSHCAIWAWIIWFSASTLSMLYAYVLRTIDARTGILFFSEIANVGFLSFTLLLIFKYRRGLPQRFERERNIIRVQNP